MINIEKILSIDSEKIIDYLIELDSNGILSEYLEELTNLKGQEYINEQTHKDNFLHTLKVIENTYKCSNDKRLRLASILHDIGKPLTKRFIKGKGWTFRNHEVVGADMIRPIFDRLKIDNSYYDYVYKIIKYHGYPKELVNINSDSSLRRLSKNLGNIEDLTDLITFCKCDMTTSYEEKLKVRKFEYDNLLKCILSVLEKDEQNNWQCPVNGLIIKEYFNILGKDIGYVKGLIEDEILSGRIGDNYEEAYKFMKTIKI